MKSISIVYKRPKTLKESAHQKQQVMKQSGMRATSNNYYTKFLQKASTHEEIMQRVRSQTARLSKMRERKNAASSLSIAAIGTPQPSLIKNATQKNVRPAITFNIKKPKNNNFFTLKLPDHVFEKQQMPLTKNTVKQSTKYARIKILTKIKCQKEATLVISVDFIYNQFNFWTQENIQEASLKTWKLLLPLANIVWIVRSECTFKKLISFTQSKNLRLDGIILVQSNKKQSLAVSYAVLQQQVKFQRGHKLLIINALRNDIEGKITSRQFRSTLPILKHHSTFIHFVRIDMNNKSRLAQIRKIVTQELPNPFNLSKILQQHRQKKGKYLLHQKIRESELISLEPTCLPSTSDQLEKLKQNLLSYFDQSFGLKTKIQGDSLSYVVGDMVKRNFGVYKQISTFCLQIQDRFCRQDHVQSNIRTKIKLFQYNRPVYLW